MAKKLFPVMLAMFLLPSCSQPPPSETESSRQPTLARLQLQAEQGESAAQIQLGLTYLNGEGVPQDYAESVRWFRAAAEQGDQRAQVNLGYMYRDGLGIPQDPAEAVRWYRIRVTHSCSATASKSGMLHWSVCPTRSQR